MCATLQDAYDPKLRALMHEVAKEEGVRYTDGVFLSGLGPSFETPAEIRAYKVRTMCGGAMCQLPTHPRLGLCVQTPCTDAWR